MKLDGSLLVRCLAEHVVDDRIGVNLKQLATTESMNMDEFSAAGPRYVALLLLGASG